MNRARHLLKSSIIVILLIGLGKLTGLIRTRLVSTAFGTSYEFDAFTAANQLPEVFFTLIAGGALAAAFIPVYSAYLKNESAKTSARLANTILNLVILTLGTISLLGAIFAPWLTRILLVPDFPPETQALTAEIMRVILIQTTIFGVSGVLSSILNAHQHFALPALAPVAMDIGYILGLFLFVPSMGILGSGVGDSYWRCATHHHPNSGISSLSFSLPSADRFSPTWRARNCGAHAAADRDPGSDSVG